MGMSANPAATAAPQPGGQQGGVYGQSAGAYNSALQGTAAGMGYNPMQVSDPGRAAAGMSAYMNPYQQQVIDRAGADMQRQASMSQNALGAQATQAGAFGGSRHGVAEGTMMGDYNRQLGDLSANLRNQGFNTALGASQQDIANRTAVQGMNQQAGLQGAQQRLGAANQMGALSQMGFGFGQSIGQQQGAQGGLMQGVNQALIDAAKGQYGNWTGAPQASLGLPMAAVGGAGALNQNTTTEKRNPGLFDYLTSFAGILGGLGGK